MFGLLFKNRSDHPMTEKNQRESPKGDVTPPKETAGDHIHTLARAGVSVIPVVGGPAVELFNAVIAPPIRKHQQEWMESVADGLCRLEERLECVVDDLKDNDAFIDTVMQASRALCGRRMKRNERRFATPFLTPHFPIRQTRPSDKSS